MSLFDVTPLHSGCGKNSKKNDQRELLERLLAKYSPFDDFDDPIDELVYDKFVSAAACGNEQVVKTLICRFLSMPAARIGYVLEVAAALSQCGVVTMILDKFTSTNLRIPDLGIRPALEKVLESNDHVMARLLTSYCDRYVVGAIMHKFGMKYQVEAVRVLAERSYQFDIAVAAFEACLAGREDIFNVLMEFTQETTALEISVKLARAGKLEFVKRGLIGRHKLDKLFAESIASGTTELVKFLLEEMSGAVIGFALLAAARIGHIEVVKLLLGRSEPWDIQFYAFEEAAKAGQANVVDYLRQWCGPARVTTIKAGLTATGGEEAAALLDTKRARFE